MLWRVLQAHGGQLPDGAMVCFANTGKEEEATLRFVRDCSVNWGVPITWVEYRDDERGYEVVDFDSASRNGEPFEALVRKKRYLPNPVARFCTADLKVTPIRKASGVDSDDTMIGVRADESRRIPRLRARGLLLPLVDAGVSKGVVRAFWKAQSFDLMLDERGGITPLGNCDLCPMKGPAQIMSMIAEKPARAVWWARMESEVGATFRSDRASYAQMAANAAAQGDLYGHDEEEALACFCGE
jgi:hypothetical protein